MLRRTLYLICTILALTVIPVSADVPPDFNPAVKTTHDYEAVKTTVVYNYELGEKDVIEALRMYLWAKYNYTVPKGFTWIDYAPINGVFHLKIEVTE